MAAAAPKYDPRPIEALASRLERKAGALTRGGAVTGALLGALVGAIPLTSLDTIWDIPSAFGVATLMVGGLVGGLIGFAIGHDRAVAYRGRAQLVLCQLRTERQTAAATQALVRLAERYAAKQAPTAAGTAQPASPPARTTAGPPVTPVLSVR
jgi:hypothetical protein